MEKLLGKDAYRAAASQTHKKLAQLKKALMEIHKRRHVPNGKGADC